MRSQSSAQRRKSAILDAQVTITGCCATGDSKARVHRRDAIGLMESAAESRAFAAEGSTMAPLAFGGDWIGHAKACLVNARNTDALARKHGFHLPAGA